MSLASRKAIPPCCNVLTSICGRSFGSTSSHSAAAQVKRKPLNHDFQPNWSEPSSSRSTFSRELPPATTSSGRISTPNWSQSQQSSQIPGRPNNRTTNRFDGTHNREDISRNSRKSNAQVSFPTWDTAVERTSRPQSTRFQRDPPTLTNKINRNNIRSNSKFSDTLKLPQALSVVNQESIRVSEELEEDFAELEIRADTSLSTGMIEDESTLTKDRSHRRKRLEAERKREERDRETSHVRHEPIIQSKPVKRVAKLVPFRKQRDVFLPNLVSVGNLARLLGVRLAPLQQALTRAGMTEISYDHLLTAEDASLIALDFGCNAIVDEAASFDIYPPPLPSDKTSLPVRPPIVTIMGHVDHGKTTLLDTLRSASVAQGEAGGITQHIGAFSLPVSSLSTSTSNDDRMITFLDTPGHAAFSAMRARGASVTDIIVLVVAADDGVMPQTKEVINLVKNDQENVGLVVAINKIDKPGADVDAVKNMLLAEGIQLEGFGGDVPVVEVSGLTGQGLDNLVETISLVSELMDLRAEHDCRAVGHVLESKIHKGLGPVATVLVSRGQVSCGSHLISSTVSCRVRSLNDCHGQSIKIAQPGTAITVSGWKELPNVGDEVLQAASEDDIKRALINRKRNLEITKMVEDVDAINQKRRLERERREAIVASTLAAEKAGRHVQAAPLLRPESENDENAPKELALLIKADVTGSAEAVAGALQGIGNDKARVKVVQSSVGDVTEGDVTLAKAIGASIVAFSVNTPKASLQLANTQSVPIISSGIIYRLMEDVRSRVAQLLPSTIETRVTGEATVQQVFDIQLKGRNVLKVAGCRVGNGVVEKNRGARLLRNGEIVYTGSLDTFKHQKKDVTEMRKGTDCGISLAGYESEYQVGDIIQMFETIEKPAVL